MDSLLQWAAPIVSTALTAYLTSLIARSEKKTDEKRAKEAEWRDSIDKRLTDIEGKQDRSIAAQAAQTRSDIVHKCHRYLDDLGRASTEEKQALKEEHEQYAQFCEDLDLENNFIDIMVQRVMELPEREV